MNFLLQAEASEVSPIIGFAPFIIIMVLFYLFFIMPQRKEQKKREAMINSLKTGDRVVTSGGLHGVITDLKDNSVILKIADNTRVEISKIAIMQVLDKI